MTQKNMIPLEVIRIQNPCHENWDAMGGDDRVRFCLQCQKHVYNLSEMTRTQAEELVASHEGRLCVRMYQRADGTVITQDCSRIVRAIRRSRARVTGLCTALVSLTMAAVGYGWPIVKDETQVVKGEITVQTIGKVAVPMGMVAVPPTTAPSTQPTTQPATQPSLQPAAIMGDMVLPPQQQK